MTRPGFYPAAELTNEAYHSSPGVSNSGLKLIGERTPAHYYAAYHGPKRARATPRPMFIGTALHAAALEPHKFDAEYVVAEFGARNEAGYKAWAAKQSKLILMEREYHDVIGMRAALHAHPVAAALLADAFEFEYSAYATDPETGVLVRIRMDLMTHGGWIVDLKKTQDASPAGASKAISSYGYHHQAAFYCDCLEWACGVAPAGFAFVFVEENPPHAVGVYVIEPEDIQRGRELYRRNLRIYARCLERNEWPAYSDQAEYVGLTRWERSRIDTLLTQDICA